jgi:hypothetical protein
MGVFHGYDDGNDITAYEIPLVGGQQVKLEWDVFSGGSTPVWYPGVEDISAATKVGIPASGVKKLNLTFK